VNCINSPSDLSTILATRAAEAKLADQMNDAYEAGELSRDAFETFLTDVTITRFPVGYTLGPCPPWCATDHAKTDDFDRGEGWRFHSSEPVTIPAVNGGATQREAWVDVCVMDNLETGTRQPAAVNVSLSDYLTPANARLLAAAIVAAAELAEVAE
jgi:hypothetical protein